MESIAPNLHPLLVHFPIALFLTGLACEWFSLVYRHASFARSARVMIGLGVFAMIPAAYSGIHALGDVLRIRAELESGPLAEWAPTSPLATDAAAIADMRLHVLFTSIATLAATLAATIFAAVSDAGRRALRWPILLVLTASAATMGYGASFGGKVVYDHGAGVERLPGKPAVAPTPESLNPAEPAWQRALRKAIEPRQAHVIAAGVVLAMTLAAFAASCRRLSADARVPAPGAGPGVRSTPVHLAGSAADGPGAGRATAEVAGPKPPGASAWFMVFLVAAATFASGLWIIGLEYQSSDFATLWARIASSQRKVLHFWVGATVVAVPLVLMASVGLRLLARPLLVLGVVLLLTSTAAQTWLGVLMYFDSSKGAATRWNPAPPPDAGE